MTQIKPHTRTRAQELRRDMTPQERLLWAKLREVNRMLGTHFRRQAPIGPYIANFVEFTRRLVIEVDGGGHGGESDSARDAWLQSQGFTVLRFWNTDVGGNLKGVMQRILDALAIEPDAPPPLPSPTRGEGRASLAASRPRKPHGTSPPPRGKGVGGRPPHDQPEGHAT